MFNQKQNKFSNLKYFYQIDLIKALAIFLVIISHTIPHDGVLYAWRVFTLLQAVPLFFIVMGRNSGASFQKKGVYDLKQLYSMNYFKSRFMRIVFPVIITFLIICILFLLLKIPISSGILFFGAGNYFVAILLEFILIFPLLYRLYVYSPKIAFCTSFLISFFFEFLIAKLSIIFNYPYLYEANILRYLFTITLGLFLIDNFDYKVIYKNKLVLIGSIISITYLIAFSIFHFQFPYFSDYLSYPIPYWGGQNCLSAFYPLILYVLLFKIFSNLSSNNILKFFGTVGKASYHIYLVQMVFFGVLGITGVYQILLYFNLINNMNFLTLTFLEIFYIIILNILIITIMGLIFYFWENKIGRVKNIFRKKLNI